jgi:large subunit ribosomal protein L23
MNTSLHMILKPRVSEKSYGLSMLRNTYVFDVPTDANKHAVKRAVEAQFNVGVTTVNVVVAKGKPKRSFQKRKQPIKGSRKDIKKAYVTLKEGDSLPIFAAQEDDKETK